jgi:hypothetical protein
MTLLPLKIATGNPDLVTDLQPWTGELDAVLNQSAAPISSAPCCDI